MHQGSDARGRDICVCLLRAFPAGQDLSAWGVMLSALYIRELSHPGLAALSLPHHHLTIDSLTSRPPLC